MPRPLVYRAIHGLRDRGLIEAAGSMPGACGPRRTLLKILPPGRRASERWLTEPIEHVRDARSHLIVKLLLLDRAQQDTTVLIERQRSCLEPIIRGLRQQIESAEGFELVIARWRLSAAEALDQFLDELPAMHVTTSNAI